MIRFLHVVVVVGFVIAPVGVSGAEARRQSDTTGRVTAVYAIQVGAFSVRENAVRLAGLLNSNGYSAVIHNNLIDGKNLLYLVWVGRYEKPADAIVGIRKIEELTGIRGVLREQMVERRR